jgi:CSLREA domain-containing protein
MLRLLSFILTLLLALPASAATFHVDSEADEPDVSPGDGVCASANDGCTLRAAVQEANALAGADTIRIPAGKYDLTHTGAGEDAAATGDLDVSGRLRVVGVGESDTVIDGKSSDRVFDIHGNARVTLFRVSVRGGAVAGSDMGGAIRTDTGSRVTLKRTVVEDSSAGFAGGGIFAGGRLKLLQSTVRGNSAVVGGGLALAANAVIRASTLDDNFASGIDQLAGSDVYATGSTAVTMVNSTSTGQIQTASFCHNGSCVDGSDFVLANVTANVLSRVTIDRDSGSFTLRNTIIRECDTDLISQGYNVIQQEGCFIAGSLNGVVIGEDPLLSSLGDHGGPTATEVPDGVSPATDAGSPLAPGSGGTACEATDQRGVARSLGDGCDIGAVEAH